MDIRGTSRNALRQILHSLLDPKGDSRALINSSPLLAATVPILERARDAFGDLQSKSALSPAEQVALQSALDAVDEELSVADGEHDDAVRDVHSLVECGARITEDETLAKVLTATLKKLYPKGQSVVNDSYESEAGAAQTLEEALTKEDRVLLGKLVFSVDGVKVSALQRIDAQLDAGKTLGKLAAKREALLAKRDAEPEIDAATAQSALKRYNAANNKIVGAIVDFVNDVNRAPELDSEQRKLLLGAIERHAARAGERASKRSKKPTPAT